MAQGQQEQALLGRLGHVGEGVGRMIDDGGLGLGFLGNLARLEQGRVVEVEVPVLGSRVRRHEPQLCWTPGLRGKGSVGAKDSANVLNRGCMACNAGGPGERDDDEKFSIVRP